MKSYVCAYKCVYHNKEHVENVHRPKGENPVALRSGFYELCGKFYRQTAGMKCSFQVRRINPSTIQSAKIIKRRAAVNGHGRY